MPIPEGTSPKFLINAMIELGYQKEAVEKGICFGFTQLCESAFLLNEMKNLEDRLELIFEYQHKGKIKDIAVQLKKHTPFKFFTNIQQTIDLLAFFDSLVLYQAPDKYSQVLGGQFYPHEFCRNTMLPPVKQQHPNDRAEPFSGLYTQEEIEQYLRVLKNEAFKTELELISIKIHGVDHSIHIGLDMKKKQWLSTNTHTFPIKKIPIENIKKVATSIYIAFADDKPEELSKDELEVYEADNKYLMLNSEISVAEESGGQLKTMMQQLNDEPQWLAIHKITKEKLAFRNHLDSNLLSFSCSSGCLLTAKKILDLVIERHTKVTNEQRIRSIELLLDFDIELNAQQINLSEAFLLAVHYNYVQIVKQFIPLQHLFDVNATIAEKGLKHPLLYACGEGMLDLVEALLSFNLINVSYADKYQRTPLWKASLGGHFEVAKMLIATKKINTNHRDINQDSLLTYAIEKENKALTSFVLSVQEFDLNLYDLNNDSAFILSCRKGDLNLALTLLNRDANIYHKNIEGKNGFDILIESNRWRDLFTLIKAVGAQRTIPFDAKQLTAENQKKLRLVHHRILLIQQKKETPQETKRAKLTEYKRPSV